MSLVGAAVSATAAPILYNTNFTGGSSNATGSFQYDSTTSTFSSFLVTWNAITMDLTSSTAIPILSGTCATPAADTQDVFNWLTATTPCGPRDWLASTTQTPGLTRLQLGPAGAVPN